MPHPIRTGALLAMVAAAPLAAASAGGPSAPATHAPTAVSAPSAGLLTHALLRPSTPATPLRATAATTHLSSGPDRALTDQVAQSTNWSGYGGISSGVLGARASWTVPSVVLSSTARYSSTWVGVDGYANSDLIQTGTEQDTSSGHARSFAWWEVLPNAARVILKAPGIPEPVRPGDTMYAAVDKLPTGKWQVYLRDATAGWTFQTAQAYSGPGTSAEWIVEAPTINGTQSVLADYRAAHLSDVGVYVRSSATATPNWYLPGLTGTNGIDMVNAGHTRIISAVGPIASASTGQGFWSWYVTAPSLPRYVKTAVTSTAYSVSWTAPVSNGHTPITHYGIEIFRNGTPWETLRTTSTHLSVTTGLVRGAHYRSRVQATNLAGYTSSWTAESMALTFP